MRPVICCGKSERYRCPQCPKETRTEALARRERARLDRAAQLELERRANTLHAQAYRVPLLYPIFERGRLSPEEENIRRRLKDSGEL